MVNPYDGKARKMLFSQGRSRSGTNESSGTTQPFERGDSVKSDDSSNSRRERPNSLPARKVSPSEISDSEEEDERKSLEVPVVSRLRTSESISSIGSLTSMYSSAGGKGNYAITGEVCIGIWYSQDSLLKVHIERARNLAATRKEGHSHPYVKVYLLPDRSKQTKRKTGFMRKTVNPKYDETFKVGGVLASEIGEILPSLHMYLYISSSCEYAHLIPTVPLGCSVCGVFYPSQLSTCSSVCSETVGHCWFNKYITVNICGHL